MNRFNGLGALIVGGANGIGAATARRLANEGAHVVIADLDEVSGHQLTESIVHDGGRAQFVMADACSVKDVDGAVEFAERSTGGISIGVHSVFSNVVSTITDLDVEDWGRVVDVGLTSGFVFARGMLPSMSQHGRGSLVFVSSIQAIRGHPRNSAYAAAKAGLVGLTRQLAVEWGRHGVRVNAVLPGLILVDRNRARWASEERLEDQIRHHPLRRAAGPEDVAGAIAFLSSNDASHITGVGLSVDGGISIAAPGGEVWESPLERD